jgi:glucose/arabinose dehydrogenase
MGGEGGSGLGGEGGSFEPPSADDCDADDGGIELPDGFCAVLAAEDLGRARHVTVTPSGDVFVAVNPSPEGSTPGEIVALRDTDLDGKLDMRATFNTTGGNGIAWQDGELFFAEADRIIKYELPDGRLEPSEDPEVVVSGLPDDGDHTSKTIVFHEGVMYVNLGSATNSCQVNNRQLESPGEDPCPELEERAGIWTFDPDALNQTAEDGVRYAEGTRNMNALAIQPSTGDLWGVQNGRDQLAENWPAFFDEDDVLAPTEELLRLESGETYGWPYCYHDASLGLVLAPEYGGDGLTIGPCTEYPEPDFAFPAHWAPLGAVFYEGTQFPDEYEGGLFVAFHGSRFEPNATGDLPGYQVAFLPFDGNEPGDDFETFASGFAGEDRPLPDEAESRPVGVTLANDGSLYISDDYGGKLWRVFYEGDD